jgi:hypothetical protein
MSIHQSKLLSLKDQLIADARELEEQRAKDAVKTKKNKLGKVEGKPKKK